MSLDGDGNGKRRANVEELRAFGDALGDALRARRMSQTELARQVGATQSMVSVWRNGEYEAPHDVVFEIEEVLDLAPGVLSRCLGYLPPAALDRPPVSSVQDAVLGDDELGSEAKHTLLVLYRHMVEAAEPPPIPSPKKRARQS